MDNVNETRNEPQANPTDELLLFRQAIRNKYTNQGTPVYLIQNQECLEILGKLGNWEKISNDRIFLFDRIEPKLKSDPNSETPVFPENLDNKGFNCSPVIIFYIDYKDHRITTIQDVLQKANVQTFLQDGTKAFMIITENEPQGLADSIKRQYSMAYSGMAYIEQFKKETEQARFLKAIPTGFKILDRHLDGGFYPGLYAIGGGTGTGKTTLMLNIAEHIARGGNQVLIISLEMSRQELFAKMISNITVDTCQRFNLPSDKYGQKTRDILKGGKPKESPEDRMIRENALEDFARNVARNIYIKESIGTETTEDIKRTLEEYRRHTGNTPVLIVDYLQILSHSDRYIRTNDKAKTDSNIVTLKQISRDYNTPVIVVSSLNRESYKDITNEVNLTSFKESGAIEYSCDVVLGLQFSFVTDFTFAKANGARGEQKELQAKAPEALKANPRKMDIKILKNRHGMNGGIIRYDFTPGMNRYIELCEPKQRLPKECFTTFKNADVIDRI